MIDGMGDSERGDHSADGVGATGTLAAPADAMAVHSLPTGESSRIATLDVYRGVALCGILLLNIIGFGLPGPLMESPFDFGIESWVDELVAYVMQLVFSDTMRGSFSLLFGAGVVLLTSRLEQDGRSAADIHYRRNIWLIVFGVIHAYILLWPGDILYRYGIASLFLYPFRKVRPALLILLGVLCILPMNARDVMTFVNERDVEAQIEVIQATVARGEALSQDDQETLDAWTEERGSAEQWQEEVDEHMREMLDGYTGPFVDGLERNVEIQSTEIYKWTLWDALVFMFLGMALFKLGVLSGERSTRFYVTLIAIGYPIGLLIRWWLLSLWTTPDVPKSAIALGFLVFEPARVLMTLAHLSVVMLLCRANVLGRVKAGLAAAGRMALTNYVGHTVICNSLFLGFGLGWYGKLTQAELLLVVIGVWLVQIPFSGLWLRFFRFGPLEWLWRSLTYVKWQPMRRTSHRPATRA